MTTVLSTWQGARLTVGRATLHAVLLLFLCSVQVMASLDDVIQKRTKYQDNCTRTLNDTMYTRTGIYCSGIFDMFVCWPHSSPGIISVPCPPYLPWIAEVMRRAPSSSTPNKRLCVPCSCIHQKHPPNDIHSLAKIIGGSKNAYMECTANGTWRIEENSSKVWQNRSECENLHYFQAEEDEVFRQSLLRVISIVGYLLSFSSLSLAVVIMGLLRKLHCTRNYVHMNLFVSFILRAVAIFMKEIVLQVMYTNLPYDDIGWNSYINSPVMSVVCKASKVSMEYFVGCNYFWLLVEAIFLHTLLFTAVLTKRRLLKRYMLIGWGTPVLFVLPWTLTKAYYENQGCWANNNRWIWWIIRAPITLSVLVIFCIFLKIMSLLLSKLKADQVKFTDYRYSLIRATLVLIPLLGIHEVVFTIIIDESVEGSSRYARNFVNLTLSSFQGLLVAVLYCFANGEVQAELKKRWQVFLVANHLEVHNCFAGIHPKFLWKSSRRHPRHFSEQSESYDEGGGPTHTHLLQVPVQSGCQFRCSRTTGLEFYTRKSLSSSDGEMTLGETLEEILEESEF